MVTTVAVEHALVGLTLFLAESKIPPRDARVIYARARTAAKGGDTFPADMARSIFRNDVLAVRFSLFAMSHAYQRWVKHIFKKAQACAERARL